MGAKSWLYNHLSGLIGALGQLGSSNFPQKVLVLDSAAAGFPSELDLASEPPSSAELRRELMTLELDDDAPVTSKLAAAEELTRSFSLVVSTPLDILRLPRSSRIVIAAKLDNRVSTLFANQSMKLFLNGFSSNKNFLRFSPKFIKAMMMRAIANLLSSALDSLAVLHREARQELRVGSQPASTPGRKQAGPARTPGELFSHLLKSQKCWKDSFRR
jgi:hypothetical protein